VRCTRAAGFHSVCGDMTMLTIRGASRVACIVIAATLHTGLSAQVVPPPLPENSAAAMAREAVSDAQQLQLTGNYDAARRLLNDAIGQCSVDRECRGRINYGLGYVTQLQATSVDSATEALSNAALRSYRAVLADFPSHADALRNIWVLYSGLGGARLDSAQLRKAAADDPARASGYLTLLGDHYASKGRVAAARARYRDAIQDAPTDPRPRRQLLSSYDINKPGEADSIFLQLSRLEATFPELVGDQYATLLADAGSEDHRNRALVRWVALQTARGRSPQAFIEELPARVGKEKAGADLRSYIESPWSPPAGGNWWLRNADTRIALARVGLEIGEQMLAVEDPARVEKCWTIALAFAPPMVNVALDLQRSLVLLYDGHPDLDPTGNKFESVEEGIFFGKGAAIAKHDLLSQQRYHSTLALVYAQRGQWRSNAFAHDAMFQLNAALRTAAERDRADGTYQPLALLRELLARGHAIANETTRSRTALMAAVRAYLDVDDIARATMLLDSTRATGEDADALRLLIRARARANAETDPGCPPRSAEILQALGSDVGFVLRQRFKLNADCAALQSGQDELRSATQALAAALSPGFSLTGAGDLRRLNQVRAIALNRIGMRTPELELHRGTPRQVRDERAQVIPLGLDDEAAFVLMPAAEAKALPRD
jgi:tetratricopeptide (TPR) repeat protein